jgi:hypothetical protein
MTKRDLALPPEMKEFFSAYMDPTDLQDAHLVDEPAPPPTKIDVWVSYVPRLRCFSAHREGMGTMQANSLRELCAKIAEALPGARIHLSRVAKREVVARRKGVRPAEGWH